MTLTWKHVAIAAVAGVALGGAGGYFARPQPAVHQVESEVAKTDRATSLDVAAVTQQAVEQKKDEAAKVRVTTEYLPAACGQRQQVAKRVVERTGPVTTDTLRTTATATESHAAVREHAETDRKLDLTITPPARSGWAVQVGLDNVIARQDLRLELRRRLFGPFWVGVSGVPDRLQVGASLSVEW